MSLSLLDFAQLVQTTLRALQMYTAGHPRTLQSAQVLLEQLNEHFQEFPNIKIVASGDRLFMDGQPGDTRSMHTTNLFKALMERNIAGIQIDKGVDLEQLIGLLEVLLLKPQRLDEMGGADTVLSSKNMNGVRLTQTKYLEVGEGEEVVAASSVPSSGSPSGYQSGSPSGYQSGSPSGYQSGSTSGYQSGYQSGMPHEHTEEAPVDPRQRDTLSNRWVSKFREGIDLGAKDVENTFWKPDFQGELPPANLKDTGRLAIELKWETSSPPAVHWEAVQLALEKLQPAEQLSVISGRASIPDIPPSLNKVLEGFVPDLIGKAAVKLAAEGAEWKGLKEAVYKAIVVKGDVSELYKAFGTHWLKAGNDASHVSEIKNRIQWDHLPINERLASIEKPGFLWSLGEDQRSHLVAQIFENRLDGGFHSLLEKAISASSHGDVSFRENASLTFEAIASSLAAYPLSESDEELFLRSLIGNFLREPNPRVMAIYLRCLQHIISMYISRDEFQRATKVLSEIDASCVNELDGSTRRELLDGLRSKLCVKKNIDPVIQKYFDLGKEYFDHTAKPWLSILGSRTVDYLLELLSEETDRRRRGQIMDSIRHYGREVLPELVKTLKSDRWYLVRNSLILIAEMADDSCFGDVVKCLNHSDQRVRRVAARTLWRGFGRRSVRPFLGVFENADPETFEEILFGLAQITAPESVPIALNYALDSRKPDRLRAMALDILTRNPSPEPMSILVEFVRRKGRIITTAEPMEIRLAAARAMKAIGQEGRAKLFEIIKSEPNGPERDELSKILET